MILRSLPPLAAVALTASAACGQTAFTYQGRLTDNGQPAHGVYDFHFRLWPGPGAVMPTGNPVELEDVQVTNGLFTAPIDFGSAFTGDDRWISVSVRPGAATGAYTVLLPRQHVTPTPYAISASSLSLPVYDVGSTDPSQFFMNPLLHLNQTGAAAAIVGQSSGPGEAVHGIQTGAAGSAGRFRNTNATNTGAALLAESAGPGPAVRARTTHPDGAALQVDGAIRVSSSGPVFIVRATPDNTSNGVLTLDHPLVNGHLDAMLVVTGTLPTLLGVPGGVPPAPVHSCYNWNKQRWELRGAGGFGIMPDSHYVVLVIRGG